MIICNQLPNFHIIMNLRWRSDALNETELRIKIQSNTHTHTRVQREEKRTAGIKSRYDNSIAINVDESLAFVCFAVIVVVGVSIFANFLLYWMEQ